jgi:hypothetical protein
MNPEGAGISTLEVEGSGTHAAGGASYEQKTRRSPHDGRRRGA